MWRGFFPHYTPDQLDGMLLWQIGVLLRNDLGRPLSKREQAEYDELKDRRNAAIRRVQEKR